MMATSRVSMLRRDSIDLDVHVLADASCLNTNHPRLRVVTSEMMTPSTRVCCCGRVQPSLSSVSALSFSVGEALSSVEL